MLRGHASPECCLAPGGCPSKSESRRQPTCGICHRSRPSRPWSRVSRSTLGGLELLAVGARRLPRGARRWGAPRGTITIRGRRSAASAATVRRSMVPTARRFRRIAASCALERSTLACAHGRARRRRQLGRAADPRRHAGGRARHVARDLRAAGAADAGRARRCDRAPPTICSTRAAPAAPTQRRRARRSFPRSARTRRSAGSCPWQVDVPGRQVDHVDFALDGTDVARRTSRAVRAVLDTRTLADGPHQLAVNVDVRRRRLRHRGVDGDRRERGRRDPDAVRTGSCRCPMSKSSAPPSAGRPTVSAAPKHALYRAVAPAQAVSIKQLDAALVGYLGLGDAAREIQATLSDAGLQPAGEHGHARPSRACSACGSTIRRARTSSSCGRSRPRRRAEAACSFAQLLRLDELGDAIACSRPPRRSRCPTLTTWQRRVLTTAIHYVGYPYVWGGTSPTRDALRRALRRRLRLLGVTSGASTS